jgi:hypothetical protein
MESRASRGSGLVGFSAVVLTIGGIFALIEGLTAVYKSSFFTANAVFVFSDLRTWGWIIFGLGVAGVISGLAVLSGSEWARWLGVTVAGVSALGQLLFAQAYPVWSLMIMAVDFLVIYGLVAYAGRQSAAAASSSFDSSESRGSGTVTDMNERERKTRPFAGLEHPPASVSCRSSPSGAVLKGDW